LCFFSIPAHDPSRAKRRSRCETYIVVGGGGGGGGCQHFGGTSVY